MLCDKMGERCEVVDDGVTEIKKTLLSLIQLAFRFLGIARSGLGLAEGTDGSIAVDLLVAGET